MKINLVSNLSGNPDVGAIWSYNEVIAYHLRHAIKAKGHEAVCLSHHNRNFPRADHTIVTSSKCLSYIKSDPEYYRSLRNSATGKLCLWLDSDFGGWYTELFDRVLVVCRQTKKNPLLYRWVGWAADPDVFRSEQTVPVVNVDSYMRGFYDGKYDAVYDLIAEAVQESSLRVLQPIKQYNTGRVKWREMAAGFRKSSYYVVTQPGYWGLTNVEAATCGAVLLVHRDFDKPRTWPSRLNHEVYNSKDELLELLKAPVDVEANRAVALQNSWEKVAERVLEAVA